MFIKLVSLIVVLMLLAVSLLVFRQQRIDLAHEIAGHHRAVQHHRQAIWRKQTRVAELCQPDVLRPRLEHIPVAFEPATPDPVRVPSEYATQLEHTESSSTRGG